MHADHGDLVHPDHATPAGWYVGRPTFYDERRQWHQYAFDTGIPNGLTIAQSPMGFQAG